MDLSTITLPFNVTDMISTGVSFLGLYKDFILIALGVIFAPALIGMAIKLASTARRSGGGKTAAA